MVSSDMYINGCERGTNIRFQLMMPFLPPCGCGHELVFEVEALSAAQQIGVRGTSQRAVLDGHVGYDHPGVTGVHLLPRYLFPLRLGLLEAVGGAIG